MSPQPFETELNWWIPTEALKPYHWLGCENPERPFVAGETAYHAWGCAACDIAMRAAATIDPQPAILELLDVQNFVNGVKP